MGVVGTVDLTALATPTVAPTLGTAASGGTIPAGSYTIKYSWINASGETLLGPSSVQVTTGSASTITITTPALPSGATGFNAYLTAGGTPGKIGTSATNSVTLTSLSPTGSLPTNNSATIASTIDLTALVTPSHSIDMSGTDHGNGAGGSGGVKIFAVENPDNTVGQIITLTTSGGNAWTNGLGAGPLTLNAAPAGRCVFDALGLPVTGSNKLIVMQAKLNTPSVKLVCVGEASWI